MTSCDDYGRAHSHASSHLFIIASSTLFWHVSLEQELRSGGSHQKPKWPEVGHCLNIDFVNSSRCLRMAHIRSRLSGVLSIMWCLTELEYMKAHAHYNLSQVSMQPENVTDFCTNALTSSSCNSQSPLKTPNSQLASDFTFESL